MKHLIVLIIAILLGIYHIKNTDYPLTVYLIQILMAVLAYNIIQRIKKRIEVRKND